MRTYDLYGIQGEDLATAKAKVGQALDLEFVAHESGYHCGLYFRHGDAGEEHFIIQSNFDSFEDEWTEPERRDKPFLLYVNETLRSDELRRRLEAAGDIELLRHQEIR